MANIMQLKLKIKLYYIIFVIAKIKKPLLLIV